MPALTPAYSGEDRIPGASWLRLALGSIEKTVSVYEADTQGQLRAHKHVCAHMRTYTQSQAQ